MRVLSLFSGGGLGDYGLEKAGMQVVGQVEIEEFCQKILALRWPDVPKWRDIRKFDGREFVRAHGPVDLISGGFPCQDISSAGRGVGIGGARSGLWKEMLRVIREVRPRFVLVENVTALLSRGLGVVLGDLAESGYDAQWDCIPASALGAPHQRDRIWIVAHANVVGHEALHELRRQPDALGGGPKLADAVLPNGQGPGPRTQQGRIPEPADGCGTRDASDTDELKDRGLHAGRQDQEGSAEPTGGGEDAPNAVRVGCDGESRIEGSPAPGRGRPAQARDGLADTKRDAAGSAHRALAPRHADQKPQDRDFFRDDPRDSRESLGRIWAAEPAVGRVAHGITNRVDRLKMLGNGQVVQVVEYIGQRIMEMDR